MRGSVEPMATKRKPAASSAKTASSTVRGTDAKRARDLGRAIANLVAEGFAIDEIEEAVTLHRRTRLPPFQVGPTPAGWARTHAVRTLIADVAGPIRELESARSNLKARERTLQSVAKRLFKRAHELGLVQDESQLSQLDHQLRWLEYQLRHAILERHSNRRRRNGTWPLRVSTGSKRVDPEEVARWVLFACGVSNKASHNWIQSAVRPRRSRN